jgi:hypothetical protein
MPITVDCHSCGNTLQAPDRLAGRKAKCAACGSIVVVDAIGIPEAIRISKPRSKPRVESKPNVEKRAHDSEPVWAVPVEPDPENAVAAELVEEEAAWVEEVPGAVAEERKPRKRRKKRRRQRESSSSAPTFGPLAWWGSLAGAIAVCLSGSLLWALQTDNMVLFIFGAVSLAIMLPVSLILLVLSMFVASNLSGGIDFGEITTAIPKALLLLFVVNIINMWAFADGFATSFFVGMFISMPVWIIGLIVLFHLDLFEACLVSFVNNTLIRLIKIFILAAVLSGMSRGGGAREEFVPEGPPGIQKNQFKNDIGKQPFDNIKPGQMDDDP